jgi:hypothetical protein
MKDFQQEIELYKRLLKIPAVRKDNELLLFVMANLQTNIELLLAKSKIQDKK